MIDINQLSIMTDNQLHVGIWNAKYQSLFIENQEIKLQKYLITFDLNSHESSNLYFLHLYKTLCESNDYVKSVTIPNINVIEIESSNSKHNCSTCSGCYICSMVEDTLLEQRLEGWHQAGKNLVIKYIKDEESSVEVLEDTNLNIVFYGSDIDRCRDFFLHLHQILNKKSQTLAFHSAVINGSNIYSLVKDIDYVGKGLIGNWKYEFNK